jgi:ribose 5-phosphate isomerase B
MRVAVGSDHAGFEVKELVKAELVARGHDVADLGTDSADLPVDYPDFGAAVGRAVASGAADVGVCVCATGVGISMAANKVAGVRAALAHDATTAAMARRHNHANVLCLGARVIGSLVALGAFLSAPEEHGRHDRRVAKLDALCGAAPPIHPAAAAAATPVEGTP